MLNLFIVIPDHGKMNILLGGTVCGRSPRQVCLNFNDTLCVSLFSLQANCHIGVRSQNAIPTQRYSQRKRHIPHKKADYFYSDSKINNEDNSEIKGTDESNNKKDSECRNFLKVTSKKTFDIMDSTNEIVFYTDQEHQLYRITDYYKLIIINCTFQNYLSSLKMTSTELSSSLTFPIKLKKIVDAPETNHLIYWDENGTSFHISDENKFARDIIPNYFKHSNISSFIRQLNMYGFHKVNRIENGLAIIGTGSDDSQWVHPNFIRDKPELLSGVVRKVTNNPFNISLIAHKPVPSSSNEIVQYDSVKSDIARLAKMVQFLKKRDEETSEQLKTLQNENNVLCEELLYLREQHEQQSKCIDMLIEFFSQYAKKPHTLTSRLKPKRNILALECPQQQNRNPEQQSNEPPRKFLVTSKSQQTSPNISNDIFKGKKIIKISNFKQPTQIDINTPKTINSNSLHRMPIFEQKQTQNAPIIYKISLPNSVNIAPRPVRAITGSVMSTPVIVSKASASSHPTINNRAHKTVTVSSHNSSPESTFNPNFFDESATGNFDITEYNLDQNDPNLSYAADCSQNSTVSSLISGITSNVTSVTKCLNDFNEMFDAENLYGHQMDYQTQSSDIENCLDEDWNMLLENIKNESSQRDPGRIQGNELIPFIPETHGHGNVSMDTYSIDDLLQTPDINPGMSSLSLDYLDGNGDLWNEKRS